MFCHKCGNEIADGAEFCHKCGEKVVYEKTIQPTKNMPVNQPEKKKSKKFPVILGMAVLAVFAAIFIGIVLLSYSDDNFDNMMELTETFSSEPDGISFCYPKAWTPAESDNDAILIQLENANIYSFIRVWKFTEMPSVANNLYDMEDTYFLENFVTQNLDVVESSALVNFNGVSAREVYYSASNSDVGTVYYRSYFYAVDSILYRVDFVKKENNPIDVDKVFDKIVNSYTIYGSNQSGNTINGGSTEWKAAYANKVQELAAQTNAPKFALIDLTGGDVPELVADDSGYSISVFTWADGKLITLMEQWSYGIGGNMGYEYLPGSNVIRNYTQEQAGIIVNESYMTVNGKLQVVNLYDKTLSRRYFKDMNGNGIMDGNEVYRETPCYYYGSTEITAGEYAAYQISGDYQWITGKQSAEAILTQLSGGDGAKDKMTGELLYQNISVNDLLGMSIETIIGEWGTPLAYSEGGGVNYCKYDGIAFSFDYQKIIFNIELASNMCSINGKTLDKSRTELIDLLGTPTKEEWATDKSGNAIYCMWYEDFDDGVNLRVELWSFDSIAYGIWIW